MPNSDLANLGVVTVKGGAIHTAPLTAPGPTSAISKLSTEWETMGRFGEDGLTESVKRTSAQTKDQWGEVVVETVTDSGLTYKAKFIETIKTVLENYYGTKLSANGTQTIVPSMTPKRAQFVLDSVLQDENGVRYIERHHVKIGQVVEVGDRARKNDGVALGYEVTIRAFPCSELLDPETGQPGSARIYKDLAPVVGEE